jgi:hypothetical protein
MDFAYIWDSRNSRSNSSSSLSSSDMIVAVPPFSSLASGS